MANMEKSVRSSCAGADGARSCVISRFRRRLAGIAEEAWWQTTVAVIIAPVCLVMAWRQGNRKRNPPSCPCGAGAAFDGAVKDRAFVKAQMSASNPTGQGMTHETGKKV